VAGGRTFLLHSGQNNQKSALLVSKGETLMVVNLENFLKKIQLGLLEQQNARTKS